MCALPLQVLAYLKRNGLKIQVTTDGRNAAVLEQVMDKGLADQSQFNTIVGQGQLGIVCNGVSRTYCADAVAELGLAGQAALA